MMKQINDIDKLFEEGLGNLEFTPNPLIKQQIQKKMFWRNFFKKFGIYIFLFFLFVGIAGLFSFNNTSGNLLASNAKQSDILNQTSVIDNANNSKYNTEQIKNKTPQIQSTNEINNVSRKIENNTKTATKSLNKDRNKDLLNQGLNTSKQNIEQAKVTSSIPQENKINNASKGLNKNTEIAVLKNKELGANTNKSTENNLLSKNNKNQNLNEVSLVKPTKEISQKQSNVQEATKSNNKTEQVLLAESKSSVKNNISSTSSTIQETVQKTSSTQASFKTDIQLKQEISKNQVVKPMLTKTCLAIPQGLCSPKIPDDFIAFDIYQNPIILPSHRWYLSLYVSPNYSFISTEILAKEQQNLAKLNQSALSPQLYYNIGISTAYQFKQLALEGGFSFAQYVQNFEATEKNLIIKNKLYWENYQTQKWKVDSTAYLNIDSIFQGDTVLIYKKDSISYFVTDSIEKNRNDSVWNTKTVAQKNVYRYIEIPLFVSYNFNRGASWQPFVGAGLVSGIYLKTQTYYVSSEKTISTQDLPFAKFVFWAGLKAGIRYQYNDKISFYTAMHYRYHLNNLFDKPKSYQQKINNVQWQWGISYRF